MSIDTQTLKAHTDLLSLCERDTTLKRVAISGGGEWAGSCPFCGGRDRFRVQPNAHRWLCRTCTEAKWEDAIGYVMRRESCDFKQACNHLGAVAALPTRASAPTLEPEPTHPPAADWQRKACEVIAECERTLWTNTGQKAREWLQARGLTDDTLALWRVGFNPQSRKIDGLWLERGITIPYAVAGKVWAVNVRRLVGEPKYQKMSGSRVALFGVETLQGRDVAVLVEGEFDAMLLWQACHDLAGVATLGSATATLDVSAWAEYLLPVSRFFVAYDMDAAGVQGADKLMALSARMQRLSVPNVNGGKDISDYYKAGGDVRAWLTFELLKWGATGASVSKLVDHNFRSIKL